MGDERDDTGLDVDAAVTRSLLGWGVVAGPFFLVVGLALAFGRDGFDLRRHTLSLLVLGDLGWAQTVNIGLSGLMAVVAGVGFARALRGVRGAAAAGLLVGGYGVCRMLGALVPPDPMAGFPPGSPPDETTAGGLLHLAFDALGFCCLAAAAFVLARRFGSYSRVVGVLVVLGFAAALLSPRAIGLVFLWLAVVVGWAWLAVTSVRLYRMVPHPDLSRRVPQEGDEPT